MPRKFSKWDNVPPEERFWANVQKTETCWLWTAGCHQGYGVTYARTRRESAHRVSYEFLVGPIPEGFQIDHLCRVPACVNPEHLEPVTPTENKLRGVGAPAVNAKKTHCYKGHPLEPANLLPYRLPKRFCLTCDREYRANPRVKAMRNAAQARRKAAREALGGKS